MDSQPYQEAIWSAPFCWWVHLLTKMFSQLWFEIPVDSQGAFLLADATRCKQPQCHVRERSSSPASFNFPHTCSTVNNSSHCYPSQIVRPDICGKKASNLISQWLVQVLTNTLFIQVAILFSELSVVPRLLHLPREGGLAATLHFPAKSAGCGAYRFWGVNTMPVSCCAIGGANRFSKDSDI